MSSWQTKKLGELFTFKNGYNADKSSYGSGTPFVNVMDIFNYEKLRKEDANGKVSITDKLLVDNSVVYGDILFNRTSENPSEIAYSAVNTDTEPITFGGFVIRGRQKHSLIDTNFLAYCFKPQKIRKEFIRRCQGVVRGNIGQKDLEKIKLDLPSVKEQKRIVSIIEIWDEYLEVLVRKIALKEQLKKGLMQQLLTGKKRLLGFEKTWSSFGFENCIEVLFKPNGLKSGDYEIKGIPIIDQSDSKYISGYTQNESFTHNFSTENPIIIFGDHSRAIKYIDQKVAFGNDGIKLFKAKNGFDTLFIYFRLLIQKIPNTGYNRHFKYLKDKIFLLPEHNEQLKIREVLKVTSDELILLEKNRSHVLKQKRYLLNNLVTGKVRTPEDMNMYDKETAHA